MKIDAYIFDLDGTLVDTENLWADAMCDYLRERNCECERSEILKMVFGRSWTDIHGILIRLYPTLAHLSALELGDEMREYYLRVRQNPQSIIIQPSVDLFRRLAANHPVIIVSGSPRDDIAEAIEIMQLGSEVKFYLGAEDYSPGKPSPACFLKGAELLQVAPEHCLVFEDSWAGIASAKSAGMWCVEIDQGGRPRNLDTDIKADWTLSTLADYSAEAFSAHIASNRQE